MNIAMCVSESVPFAKTGGLADVAGALPGAINKLGSRAIVVMPGYSSVFEKHDDVRMVKEGLSVRMNNRTAEEFSIFKTTRNDVEFYFIRNDKYFARENLYGTLKGRLS